LDFRSAAIADDLDRGILAVPEIDLDQASLVARIRQLHAHILAVTRIDFDAPGFVSRLRALDARDGLAPVAVYLDSRPVGKCGAIVAVYR
jgi:hypothetical protein